MAGSWALRFCGRHKVTVATVRRKMVLIDAQDAIDVERIRVRRHLETLRQDDLERVTRPDVLPHGLDARSGRHLRVLRR